MRDPVSDHAAWNEEMAKRYDPDLFHSHPSPFVRFVRNRRVGAIHKLLGLRPHHSVLDVGCGAGNILAELHCRRRVGTDLSDFLLEKAKNRLGNSAELVKSAGETLPFEDRTFDRAICSEVLEHVPDPAAIVGEIRRVLKPDGVAVITVPNEQLINRVKTALIKTKLFGLVTRRGGEGYQTPEKMEDEWHLQEFDAALLRRVTEPHFRIAKLAAIPLPGLPLGYAAQLVPR